MRIMSLIYQRMFVNLMSIIMIEKEQHREAFFNDDPLILNKELVIQTAVKNPCIFNAITIQEYFDRGNAKIEQQDYKGAVDYFSRAIEISPENSMVYFSVFRNI